jgi:PAS domain S-box-containing protein
MHEKEVRALLAAIVDSSDDAIVSKSLDGRILSWNAGAERIFGYAAAEAVGQSIDLIVPPERREEEQEILRRLRRGERIEHLETVRLAKDGRRVHISLTVSPIRDETGRILGASKVARDVTEQRRAREGMAENEHRLQVIMDATPALISYIDRDLRYAFVNRRYEEWFGHPRESVVGRAMSDVLGPAAMEVLGPHVEAVLAGKTVHFEAHAPYHEGGGRWIDAQYVPDVDPGGSVRGFFVFVLDVTLRKEAEEALKEADRRKDEFLATLAHELRNPLAPLRNSVEIMKRAPDDPALLRQARQMMERQLALMERIIEDLLDVSRITRNRLHLRMERVELASILHHAIEVCRPLAERSRHEITLTLPTDPIYLEGDSARLAQVFSNLLTNACKYTEPGGRIQVAAERQGGEVAVSVKDDGIGIPPEMLPHIFEIFTQVDRSPERVQGGLGIGLTLVRQLVELHRGRVVAHSEGPGLGSEFVVRLPAVEGTRAPAPGPAREAPPSSRPRRILVVEDNRDGAESLQRLLLLAGHEIELAYDGLAALEAAERFRPDLVLLDLGLPRLNGYEACRRLRAQPWGKGMRVVALTGWGQEGDRRRTQRAGFDGHLVKPVDPARLEEVLNDLDSAKPQTHPFAPGPPGA